MNGDNRSGTRRVWSTAKKRDVTRTLTIARSRDTRGLSGRGCPDFRTGERRDPTVARGRPTIFFDYWPFVVLWKVRLNDVIRVLCFVQADFASHTGCCRRSPRHPGNAVHASSCCVILPQNNIITSPIDRVSVYKVCELRRRRWQGWRWNRCPIDRDFIFFSSYILFFRIDILRFCRMNGFLLFFFHTATRSPRMRVIRRHSSDRCRPLLNFEGYCCCISENHNIIM